MSISEGDFQPIPLATQFWDSTFSASHSPSRTSIDLPRAVLYCTCAFALISYLSSLSCTCCHLLATALVSYCTLWRSLLCCKSFPRAVAVAVAVGAAPAGLPSAQAERGLSTSTTHRAIIMWPGSHSYFSPTSAREEPSDACLGWLHV